MGSLNRKCAVCQERLDSRGLWATAVDIEYSTEGQFEYLECPKCKCLMIDPVPRDLNKIYPDNYYSFDGPSPNFLVRIKNWLEARKFKKILLKLKGSELAVLDVGGGTGWLLNQVRAGDSRVKKTVVVDLNQKCRPAAEAQGHQFILGKAEDMSEDLKFDFILALNLIEHVEDPKGLLSKFDRLLKPGGLVLLKTPNYLSLDARMFRRSQWAGLHCPRHFTIFSENSFQQMVSQTGLSVHEFSYTQGAPFWSMSLINYVFWNQRHLRQNAPLDRHPLMLPLMAVFAVFDSLRIPFGARTSQFFSLLTK